MENKPQIEFSEFLEIEKKLDIRIGFVSKAERIPKSDKLIKLTVMFSPDDERTVVTNLGSQFELDDFIGVKFPFITNLKPSKMMGVTSEAMIIIGTLGDNIILENYPIGTKLI